MSRLWKRFRSALSFVSDLGGALLFIIASAGVLAAGIGGTVFVAWGIFPQPFLTFIILGIALGAAGLTLHVLRDRLAPPLQPEGPVLAARELTPNEQAAALTRAYQNQFGDSATQDLRKGARSIREELLDNRLVLDRVLTGDPFEDRKLGYGSWYSYEKVLIAYPDPAPHTDASQAYRELGALSESHRKRDDFDLDGGQPLETDLQSAIEAIDNAVGTLDGLNSDWQPFSRSSS